MFSLKGRQFRFSPITTGIAVVAALICYSMSYWQQTRYVGKQAYFEQLAQQEALGRRPLDPQTQDWASVYHGEVQLSGTFDYDHEMVLINRSKEMMSGVKSVVPLKLEGSERHVLVDRGFLPYKIYAEPDLRKQSHPAGVFQIEGLIRPSQTKAFFLAPDLKDPLPGEWRERWLRLDVSKMSKQLPYKVLPIYIEQTNTPPEGFPVYNARSIVTPGRHLNYTIQWASFGTFALLFSFFLQFRSRAKMDEKGREQMA